MNDVGLNGVTGYTLVDCCYGSVSAIGEKAGKLKEFLQENSKMIEEAILYILNPNDSLYSNFRHPARGIIHINHLTLSSDEPHIDTRIRNYDVPQPWDYTTNILTLKMILKELIPAKPAELERFLQGFIPSPDMVEKVLKELAAIE